MKLKMMLFVSLAALFLASPAMAMLVWPGDPIDGFDNTFNWDDDVWVLSRVYEFGDDFVYTYQVTPDTNVDIDSLSIPVIADVIIGTGSGIGATVNLSNGYFTAHFCPIVDAGDFSPLVFFFSSYEPIGDTGQAASGAQTFSGSTFVPIPEPATVMLLGIGVGLTTFVKRRSR